MSRKQLTAKQHDFLQFLAEHVRKHKVWPTYREIVDSFGYRSPNSVTQNLQALAKKGFLTRDRNGYRLIGQPSGLQPAGFPVQGTASGGEFEISLSIDQLTLKDIFPELDTTFAVQIDGQDVRGVDVEDGGYVLLHEGDVKRGDTAVVLSHRIVCVCRVYPDGDRFLLQHADGTEVWVDEGDDFELLGRYAGHIDRHGLSRAAAPSRAPSPRAEHAEEMARPA